MTADGGFYAVGVDSKTGELATFCCVYENPFPNLLTNLVEWEGASRRQAEITAALVQLAVRVAKERNRKMRAVWFGLSSTDWAKDHLIWWCVIWCGDCERER